MSNLEMCPGCQLQGHADGLTATGATDPYGGASASCWALFGEVLARDFGAYQYPAAHRFVVDAYMAQHPGYATAAGRRSVVVHLVGLYLALVAEIPPRTIGAALAEVFPQKNDPAPLLPTPLPAQGRLNVAAIHATTTAEDHDRAARAWATDVWASWQTHHATIETLARAALTRAQETAGPARSARHRPRA